MSDTLARVFLKTLVEDAERCWVLIGEARYETAMARERDIREMIPPEMHDQLPDDIPAFLQRDFEYQCRQFFRAAFALIEGAVFAVKTRAAHYCLAEGIELADGEIDFAAELDHKLNSNGTVTEQRAHIRLVDNVRLTIAICEKSRRMPPTFDANKCEWWPGLMESIRVRDRLMHPKKLEDLAITQREVEVLYDAHKGLLEHFAAYPKLVYSTPPDPNAPLEIRRLR